MCLLPNLASLQARSKRVGRLGPSFLHGKNFGSGQNLGTKSSSIMEMLHLEL